MLDLVNSLLQNRNSLSAPQPLLVQLIDGLHEAHLLLSTILLAS